MPHDRPLPLLIHKRLFDIALSAILIILLFPLFLFFFLLLMIEHTLRGRPFDPLIYSETRISRGAPFLMYKFNIFDQRVVDAFLAKGLFIHTKELEHSGAVSFVGALLKQIYFDELPQLFNVLRGEMSLVGPRPLNLEVFLQVSEGGTPAISFIQGGMTGAFQSRKNTRGYSAHELDALYLERYRKGNGWRLVLLDLSILLRTLKVLLRAKGV